MMTKLITRTAAGLAATGIATLPLIIGTSAHAINKHEAGGGGDAIVLMPPDNGRHVDPAQVAAGALAGATVTGAAFVASNRIRRVHDSAPRPV
ncbi:hypothetical protein [Kribbella sp. VKM Ac-2568]|uniref:hypothetical protein n=1 Tax=Kribbella sp. VKM Ac-2568 TaxID=2512219 RepID=UPI00104DC010|nr:hypothetical protein [Kribbella sp. VKM Ac-2568]TCM33807.1 hypothetical protein EV648_1292 [Kribbella sp. VKM Ac-2568]